MSEILTSEAHMSADNAATNSALNPFLGGSHVHANPLGHPPVALSWEIRTFPITGLVFLSGTFVRANVNWTGRATLDVAVAGGDETFASSTSIVDDETGRWGVGVIATGAPFSLTFTLTIAAAADFGNALFFVGPANLEKPVFESTPRLFDLGSLVERTRDRDTMTLTSANQGGLMNRLVPMLSTVFVAERIGRRPQVLWGPNEHCAASFPDLFDVPGAAGDLGALGTDYRVHLAYGPDAPPLPRDAAERNVLVHSITPIQIDPPLEHDHSDLGALFKRIRLAAPIRAMMAPFDRVDFSRTVALHIRRPYPGGAFAALENAKFSLGLDVFLALITDMRSALPWIERFLICTNSLEAEAEIVRVYGDGVFAFEKSSIDNTRDPVAVQEALVDMMLMSRCPLIVSQETTSFGHFAHLVGGNTMVAVTADTNEARYNFWQFSRGRHAASASVQRGDKTELDAVLTAWLA